MVLVVDHDGDEAPEIKTVGGGFESGVDSVLADSSHCQGGQDRLVPAHIVLEKIQYTQYTQHILIYILNIHSIY
jgi:hypothetical protein